MGSTRRYLQLIFPLVSLLWKTQLLPLNQPYNVIHARKIKRYNLLLWSVVHIARSTTASKTKSIKVNWCNNRNEKKNEEKRINFASTFFPVMMEKFPLFSLAMFYAINSFDCTKLDLLALCQRHARCYHCSWAEIILHAYSRSARIHTYEERKVEKMANS